ncbi:HdeD family acid-resistance protein [Neosynechococcus sphagnicola]|uniref:HdeD family acid-resistance protein n=1 Tax=Neosynechococcus sphagnicola TaxID=1501145 RepID=UPI00138E16C3|nr:DUF308 domain-containing protein [Neosynechococcus sphagnicola]
MRVTDPEADGLVLNSAWTNKIALLMMILGIISILFPLFVAVTSILLFGWVFIFAGISQILYALQSRNSGQVVWKTILGLLYLLAGIFLVTNPRGRRNCLHGVLGITILCKVSFKYRLRCKCGDRH